MPNKILSVSLALAFAVITGQARTGNAQVVPFGGSGTQSTFDPATGHFEGVGNASHFGRMGHSGDVLSVGVFFPADGVFFSGTFTGTQTYFSSNGDTLHANLSGEVLLVIDEQTGLVSGTWLVQWDITGGTGRFAGATGTTTGAAINPPFNPAVTPWLFDWYFSGELNLAKRPR
jgi:hypothetical protein